MLTDEEDVEKQEQYERKYNFRFEDEEAANVSVGIKSISLFQLI